MTNEKQHKITVYRNYEGTDVYLFPNTLSFDEIFEIVNDLQTNVYHCVTSIWGKCAKGTVVRFILDI